MEDALAAYGAGHTDGHAGVCDATLAADPETGADYRTGLLDGQVVAFEEALLDAVRRALGEAD
jgi:hypothetical protein